MRPKKAPREAFASTLKPELLNEIRKLSDETGVPISKLMDQAVELLIKERKEKYHIDINLDDK